jgi:putative transposase
MSRLPRIIVPGVPHHVTQRGNRRQRVFMKDDDDALYSDWLAQACRSNGVEAWSDCLMPNHVHVILVPSDETGLSRAIGETPRRFSGDINARLRVTVHVFQGRFGCVAMDDAHVLAAVRSVAWNPVKARLAATPADWSWSSTPAHLRRQDDGLVTVRP